MSEKEVTGWQRLVDQISHPMDWAGLAFGVAAGALVSGSISGVDAGGSVLAGGSLGVGVTKSVRASSRGLSRKRRVKKRASGLRAVLQDGGGGDLLDRLNKVSAMYESGALDAKRFEEELVQITDQFLATDPEDVIGLRT